MNKQGNICTLFEKKTILWLCAAMVTLICYMILAATNKIVFFINDDENILYTLAGYYTAGNTADHSFVNAILSFFIQGLYSVLPQFPWYGIFHVVVLFSSLAILERYALGACAKNRTAIIYTLLFSVLFFFALYFYPVLLMQFTTTSAIAGMASITLLLYVEGKENKATIISRFLFSLFYLLLCFWHRKNTGYVVLCFWGLALVYKLVSAWIKTRNIRICRSYVVLAAAVCVSISFSILLSSQVRSNDSWDFFYEYDQARYKEMDYPHDSYEENPQLYEALDWSEALYRLEGKLFFMDERINADSFNIIAQTGFYANNKTVSAAVEEGKDLLQNNEIALVATVALTVLAAICLIISVQNKNWIDMLLALCNTGGILVLCAYLCWKQRFILRAFQAMEFPALAIYLYILVRNMPNAEERRQKKKQWKSVVVPIIGVLACIWGIYLSYPKAKADSEYRYNITFNTLAVEEYAMDHPDNIYVYDVSLTFRYHPFIVYTEDYPSNLMFWGGMGWNSPAFFEQLDINGLKDLYSDVLLEENVYFVSRDSYYASETLTSFALFEQYMKEEYPGVEIKKVESLPNDISIYKFVLA